MYTLHLRVLHLSLRLLQPFLQTLLVLRAPAPETLLKDLNTGRCQEQEASMEVGALDLLDALQIPTSLVSQVPSRILEQQQRVQPYLHLNIQNTDPPLLRNLLHGPDARPIIVSPELCMLDKPIRLHQIQKRLFGREIVLYAIPLARARSARRVCHRHWFGLFLGRRVGRGD